VTHEVLVDTRRGHWDWVCGFRGGMRGSEDFSGHRRGGVNEEGIGGGVGSIATSWEGRERTMSHVISKGYRTSVVRRDGVIECGLDKI